MGLLNKILGEKKSEVNIEEILNTIEQEELVEEEARMYVKPVNVRSTADVPKVVRELQEGNIVIMNIKGVMSRPVTAREVVERVKDAVVSMGGDMARISEDKILVTPSGVKIVKRRR